MHTPPPPPPHIPKKVIPDLQQSLGCLRLKKDSQRKENVPVVSIPPVVPMPPPVPHFTHTYWNHFPFWPAHRSSPPCTIHVHSQFPSRQYCSLPVKFQGCYFSRPVDL